MALAEKLESIRKAAETRIPAEARAIMHRATEDLRASGIAERVVKVGQKAPAFSLPNQRGEIVSSRALLADGPLVVSFYRGVW
jgi:hypothetical protein